jgi:hypothetical protein
VQVNRTQDGLEPRCKPLQQYVIPPFFLQAHFSCAPSNYALINVEKNLHVTMKHMNFCHQQQVGIYTR